MALSESAKLSIAFKKLIGREHRYSSNQWYNECPDRTLVFHKDVIMVNSIPSVPPAATSSAIKVYTVAGDGDITMCADNTIPGNRGWRANDGGALRNFVHPKFGFGYVVRVYEDDGIGGLGDEIPSSDTVEWTFDYENGYLSLENSPTSWTLPIHITAYKYTGDFLDKYLELTALATDPATPPANTVRLYALDSAGTTKLLYIDSAGTKTQLGAGGGGGFGVYIEEGASAVTNNAASNMYVSFGSDQFDVTTASGTSVSITLEDPLRVGTLNVTAALSVQTTLHVSGAVTMGSSLNISGATSISNTLWVSGSSTFNGITNSGILTTTTLNVTANASVQGTLWVSGSATFNGITNSGAITTQTFNVTANASVGGTLWVCGTTTLNGLTVSGNLTVSNLSVTANATVVGTLKACGAVTFSSTLQVSSDVTLSAKLNVSAAASLSSTLHVSGAVTFGSTLGVSSQATFSNNVIISGTLTVSGATTISGAVLMNSTLGVTGAATFHSTIAVSGTATLDSTVTINDNLNVSGNLTVCGNTTVNALSVTGAATVVGTLKVCGIVTFSNNLIVSGTLSVAGATTMSGSLTVSGNTSVSGTLFIGGAAVFGSTVIISNTLTVCGVATIESALLIKQYIEFTAAAGNPAAGVNCLRLYAKVTGTGTKLMIIDSAGATSEIPGAGGAGADTQLSNLTNVALGTSLCTAVGKTEHVNIGGPTCGIKTIYTKEILSTTADGGFLPVFYTCSIFPTAAETYQLGNPTYYWGNNTTRTLTIINTADATFLSIQATAANVFEINQGASILKTSPTGPLWIRNYASIGNTAQATITRGLLVSQTFAATTTEYGMEVVAQFTPNAHASSAKTGIGGFAKIVGSNFDSGSVTGLNFSPYILSVAGGHTNMNTYGAQLAAVRGFSLAGTIYYSFKNAYGLYVKSVINDSNLGACGIATYGVYIDDNDALTAGAYTAQYGLAIAKPTRGTNNYQAFLSGEGTGSGIWFSTVANGPRIFASATNDLNISLNGSAIIGITPSQVTIVSGQMTYQLVLGGVAICSTTTGPGIYLNGTTGIRIGCQGGTGTASECMISNMTVYSAGNDFVMWDTADKTLHYQAVASARKYKTNIKDWEEDIYKILQVKPKTFNWINTGTPSIGYIAEDIEDLGLEKLIIREQSGELKGLHYDKFSLYAIEVIKEQDKRIHRLEDELTKVVERLNKMVEEK